MTKNDIAKKLLNNLLFKYDKTCDIRAFHVEIDNCNNSYVVGSLITDQFNDSFTVDINEDKEDTDTITIDSNNNPIIRINDSSRSVNNNSTANFYINIEFHEEDSKNYILYNYKTEYCSSSEDKKTDNVIELSGFCRKEFYFNEADHVIIIINPLNKVVPIILDYEYTGELLVNKDYLIKFVKDKIDSLDISENIFFNSYISRFSTKSYKIVYNNSFKDITSTPVEDKLKELDYLKYDEYSISGDSDKHTYIYNNTYTEIGYVTDQKHNEVVTEYKSGGNLLTKVVTKNGESDIFHVGHRDKDDNFIHYVDYGYMNKGDTQTHMERITDSEFLSENEMKLLSQLDYINFDSIDYDNEYPMAIHKKLDEPGIFTKEDYKECLGKLYPYKWIDEDSTYNDRTYIDLIGVIPTDDDSMVNIKISLINEEILIEYISYTEGTKTILNTNIRNKDNKILYKETKTTEASLYATNVITECNLDNGMKFRIIERTDLDIQGNIIGNKYQYESPELNIIIDRTNNTILDFSSGIYNMYYDSMVPVRGLYGCLEYIDISQLHKI